MEESVCTTSQLVDVDAAFAQEGLTPPPGLDLASAGIWILPTTKHGAPLFESPAVDALKLAAEHGLPVRMLTQDEKPRLSIQKSADVLLPTLLVFAQGALQVPWSMLANYLTALVRLYAPDARVRMRVYVDESAGTFEVDYKGPGRLLVKAMQEARKIRNA